MRPLLILFCLFFSLNSSADIFDRPQAELVMNRKFTVTDEFQFQGSYLPVGALNKYLGLGGSYIKYFGGSHAWEMFNFQYAIELESQLKRDLQKPPFSAKSSDLPVLQFLATSNYVFSPFYSKSVLFNSRIVFSELSFFAGGGIAQFTTETIPVVDFGLAQRFFRKDGNAFKFDFRYYAFIANKELLRNQMTLGLVYVMPLGEKKK
jgi:outer membrane beta-barrel protein